MIFLSLPLKKKKPLGIFLNSLQKPKSPHKTNVSVLRSGVNADRLKKKYGDRPSTLDIFNQKYDIQEEPVQIEEIYVRRPSHSFNEDTFDFAIVVKDVDEEILEPQEKPKFLRTNVIDHGVLNERKEFIEEKEDIEGFNILINDVVQKRLSTSPRVHKLR